METKFHTTKLDFDGPYDIVSVDMPDTAYEDLKSALEEGHFALGAYSNDAEHDALVSLVEAVQEALAWTCG